MLHSTKIPLTWTETQHVIIHFTLNSKDEKLGDNFFPMAFLAPDSTVLWPEFWATLSWSLQGIQLASVFLSSFDPTSFCNENITTNKISDQHVEPNAKWQIMPKYIPSCECHAHPGLLGNGHADLLCQNKQITCSQGPEKQENWSRRFPGLKIAQKLEYLEIF